MNVLCEECNTAFSPDESTSDLEGGAVQCPGCGHSMTFPVSAAEGAEAKADRIWFVAVNDVQVGPVTLAELEEKFSAGEVNGDSLVWRGGWEDWEMARISNELSYLVEMYEVESGQAAASLVEAPVFEPATILFDSFAEEEPAREGVGWAPSAASELSNLAAEELNVPGPSSEGEARVQDVAEAPLEVSEQDIPDFKTPQELPSSPRGRSGASLGWLLVAGVVVAGGWFMQEEGRVDALLKVVKGALEEPSASVVADEAPAPSPSAPMVQVIKVPPKKAAPKVAPKASKASKASKVTKTPKVMKVSANPRPASGKPAVRQPVARPPRPAKPPKAAPPKTSALDSVFESSRASVKERLSKKDIVDGVRANARTVMGCLKRARKKGEIVPGTHKVILDWTIKADGRVISPRFKGPVNLMSTSLPTCFEASMLHWTFAESKKGAPIRNYPFGPFTVR